MRTRMRMRMLASNLCQLTNCTENNGSVQPLEEKTETLHVVADHD